MEGLIAEPKYEVARFCIASARLTVEDGQCWKAANIVLPRKSGKCAWHPFEKDVVVWPSFDNMDWQDHIWNFTKGTFHLTASSHATCNNYDDNGETDKRSLLETLRSLESIIITTIVDDFSFSIQARDPTCYLQWNKFPHNCGSVLYVMKKEE